MEWVGYETEELAGDEAESETEEESRLPSASAAESFRSLDLAYGDWAEIPAHYGLPGRPSQPGHPVYHPRLVLSLSAHHNRLHCLPPTLPAFSKLIDLDLSYNSLPLLPEALAALSRLRSLNLKNNHLETESFPKSFAKLGRLESLQLSGNNLAELPLSILALPALKSLYLGANRLRELPEQLGAELGTLEHLYLGGNQLRSVPASIGSLWRLSSLHLSDNRLEAIPASVANLVNLQSLSLHNNQLKALPVEIVKLSNLGQLSLRNNPLVYRFARDMVMEPPSLLELAGRVVKVKGLPYREVVPRTLSDYLGASHECVNPKCKGVYFDARVEHVKFVDFCGKYRVPLLQYLCSPVCEDEPAWALTSDPDSDPDQPGPSNAQPHDPTNSSAEDEAKLKKVLLG